MRPVVRWVLLCCLALALILIPFALYEEAITAWARNYVESDRPKTAVALMIAALLASDILLPVPSSLIATASGYLLGLIPGAAVTWAGMTLGALLGYGLGRKPARAFTRRFVGDAELARASAAQAKWGDWAVVACRSVPVLAEASVVFAGVAGMPLPRFLLLSGLSNLAIAVVYAMVGAYAMRANSFLLAFFGAVALPGLALLLFRKRG